jgi:hypothetical protein
MHCQEKNQKATCDLDSGQQPVRWILEAIFRAMNFFEQMETLF